MSAVENPLSISFSAEVAFSLVDPARASGPVSATRAAWASARSGEPGLQVAAAVNAPRAAAAASAPAT